MDAMDYLQRLGHTRIAFISGRAELESSTRRLKGYRDALEEAGIPIDEQLIAAGDYTTVTGVICARELLALERPPTAIFAWNDQMAMGVHQVAQELRLRIPEDLSVVGFDNIMESRYMGLTTVDQFISEMGYVATRTNTRIANHYKSQVNWLKLDMEASRPKKVAEQGIESDTLLVIVDERVG